jgi:hypothetical protein
MVDRDGERRLQRSGVVFDDKRQIEPFGQLGQNGHTKLPPPVGNHKIDDLGRDLFGRTDKIAFVFAVLGIHHNDDLPGGNGLDGGFNA